MAEHCNNDEWISTVVRGMTEFTKMDEHYSSVKMIEHYSNEE
jgi:hypothetical protein